MSRETGSLVTQAGILTDEQRKAVASPPLSNELLAFQVFGVGMTSCVQLELDHLFASDFGFNRHQNDI